MHHFIRKMTKIKLNNKYINIYVIFIDLINLSSPPIHPQLIKRNGHFLVIFLDISTSTRIRSRTTRYSAMEIGGNEHNGFVLSLFAEVWNVAYLDMNQDSILYLVKITTFGQQQRSELDEAICNVKYGIIFFFCQDVHVQENSRNG
eukprot:1006644_1